MDSSHKSRFWELAISKLRFRRQPRQPKTSDEVHSLDPDVGLDNTETQKDGFYRYSESLLEEANSLLLQQTESLEDGSECFVMAPSRRHSRPYTVSSEEWVLLSSPSSPSQVLSLDDLSGVQLSIHFGGVLNIFTKLYAMGKMMHVVFLSYGVELDTSETGLMYWVQRAEEEVRTNSLATLIEIVENLFYALYARVVLEMASIELCSCFNVDVPSLTTHRQFILPHADHLYRIFLACKDVLDSPVICEMLQQELVARYQEGYTRRVIHKENEKGLSSDDILGYRRYALSIVSERSSAFCKKWETLIPLLRDTPAEVMAVLSEKYLAVVPKSVLSDDISYDELPFTDLITIDPATWEKDTIQDHRLATLAKLEGNSVGQERRDDANIRLFSLAKRHKCVCASVCRCSYECTNNVERRCPCAERQLRIMLAKRRKGTGRYSFATRAYTLARVGFESLATLKRHVDDDDILIELGHVFEVFDLEIQKERSAAALSTWT
ncbi:hypothetical protein NUU61_001006 [Penicillium alfredii]|uniref:Uncharacterized protein n=1 Tax=Penicillium alfredii TaxID=1506179 RepID=A0A9W9KRF9_9EURO|nr:uncharacterized protein NUU61_001006 [Penicillium alfredii]KAJ5115247.1 hypothetical protein NUU61_001006 [Penicillium alfredii]